MYVISSMAFHAYVGLNSPYVHSFTTQKTHRVFEVCKFYEGEGEQDFA
jgi:hypothetical protein